MRPLHNAVQAFRYLNLVAFIALGAVTLVFWLRRRDRASRWAAVAFGALGLLELLTPRPEPPRQHCRSAPSAASRSRSSSSSRTCSSASRTRSARRDGRLANGLVVLTVVLVVWTFALPRIPQPGEHRPASFTAWVAVFFVHWSVLSIVSARQPLARRRRAAERGAATHAVPRAGKRSPHCRTPARDPDDERSTRRLSSARRYSRPSASPRSSSASRRRSSCASAGAQPEQARLQQAIASLLTFAESQEEVASRVLEPAAAIVGARAIAIRNAEGRVVAAWNVPARRVGRPRARPAAPAAVGRRGARRPRGARREPRRLDLPVRAVLRRRGARAAPRRSARSPASPSIASGCSRPSARRGSRSSARTK